MFQILENNILHFPSNPSKSSYVNARASQRFYNHGEGLDYDLLLVEDIYNGFYIWDTIKHCLKAFKSFNDLYAGFPIY